MREIVKKNQIIILVTAFLLIAVGYFNFTEQREKGNTQLVSGREEDSIGDAAFVYSNAIVNNEAIVEETEIKKEDTEDSNMQIAVPQEELEETSTSNTINTTTSEYFTNTKLQRDRMYSQMIESYQNMMNANNISAEQKAIAQNEITKINETQNGIMITENLIQSKGFKDIVILVNKDSINVILDAKELKAEDVAKIQNIVAREMSAEIENIHISNP